MLVLLLLCCVKVDKWNRYCLWNGKFGILSYSSIAVWHILLFACLVKQINRKYYGSSL